ncbi:MAG: glucose-6-phosphate isomerase [Candidatus Doudnabacteria bacterium]|nr:glucose-6-phosphate isomerase [Candidatus Doudnabacteria bacterium]
MLNLEKTSGLPIEIREDYSLVFGKALPPVKPQIRDFTSMKNYLQNPLSSYWRKDVYHMYRDVALPEHKDLIHEAGLEYDITIIPPGRIGDELVKTIGHYHPYKRGLQIRYPEVYEVIHGKAFLLLQSASPDLDRLEDVYLVEASRGEKIVIPPGFGHVSVNPSDDVLVLSNWQPLGNKGIYEPYEAHNGGAYYVIRQEHLSVGGKMQAEFEFAPNLSYNLVPPLRKVQARELPQYDLRSALPMYFTGTQNLKSLDFVINPENYVDELTPEKLFK